MAVATLWMVTLGAEEITSSEVEIGARRKLFESAPIRHISCFLNGLLTIVARF